MPTAIEVRQQALALGRRKKSNNAISALLSGALPGILLAHFLRPAPVTWLIGILIGLVWGNAFEYCYHRWLLHWPQSSFGRGHILHHGSLGCPNEPEHVTFGDSPVRVTILFWSNAIPLLLFERWLRLGLSPGIMVAWAMYLISVEEIHWRVHLGGWLPPLVRAARTYHLAHHDVASGRFNVFFPLFDWIFGDIRPSMDQIVLPPSAAAADQVPWPLLIQETILYVWLVILAVDRHVLSGLRTKS